LPRPLHLPALPGLRLRVAPYHAPFLLSRRSMLQVAPWLRTFGCAGDVRSSYPELLMPSTPLVSARSWVSPVFLLPPSTPAMEDLGSPLCPASPALTGDRSSSRLDSLSFGGAGCESSRLPCRFAPPVSPTISIQVALNAHPPAPADGMSESPRIASPSGSPL
jgi:hypothetical protein